MTKKQYQTYILNQGDSLEGIAYSKLGATERWREIVALNTLRYPFISDKPADWYGPIIANGLLSTDLGRESVEIKIPGESKDIIVPHSIFFLESYRANGESANVYVWEALEVEEYDPVVGVVFLLTPTVNSWKAGVRYRIYPPVTELGTKVAKTGDRILLPIEVSDDGTIGSSGTELYGTDIELHGIYENQRKGRPILVDGDLATVSGYANMSQALWMRTMLPYGSYLIHPEEGNRMWDMIGGNVYPEKAFIAASYLRDALFTDPRVAEISDLTIEIPYADTIKVDAVVRLEGSEQAISLNEIIRSQTGG